MQEPNHNLAALFEQLGLDNSDEAIEAFIERHRPLAGDIPLARAACWSSSQSAFLQQSIEDDADWSIVVDQLNSLLR